MLLPLVEDTGWFFDTELLVLAERTGLRIHEVPVDWVDDPDCRVDIVATARARPARDRAAGARPRQRRDPACAELRPRAGAASRRRRRLAGQVVRFAAIGVVEHPRLRACSTSLLRGPLGAQGANVVALLLTAVGNTAANRRFTFGVRGRAARRATSCRGCVVLRRRRWPSPAGARRCCTRWCPTRPAGSSSACSSLANLVATVLRFLLLRHWVFRRRTARAGSAA